MSPDDAGTSNPPPGQHSWPRRLERSPTEKVLAGVCGGLAEYFGLDPVIFRIAFVVLAVAGGAGVPLYVAGWALLPERGQAKSPLQQAFERPRNITSIVALVLVAIGAANLAQGHFFRAGHVVWGVLLVAAGVAIFTSRQRGHDHPAPPPAAGTAPPPSWGTPPPPPPPVAPPPPSPATPPSPASPPPATPSEAEAPTTAEVSEPTTSVMTAAPTPPWVPPAESASANRPRRGFTPIALSVLLVGVGAAALLDAGGVFHASVPQVLAGALAATGVALIIGGFRGGARGLLAVGVLLAVALGIASFFESLHVPLSGSASNRVWRPASIEELRQEYSLGAGSMTIDLSAIPWTGAHRSVRARMGVGRLVLVLPDGVGARVTGHTGAGGMALLGHESGGVNVSDDSVVPPLTPDAGEVTVTARVGVGRLEVRRASQ